MKGDELDLLILRYLSGELNREESERLRALVEQDPEVARRVLMLADEELLFRKGLRKSRTRPSRFRWAWLASAGILLGVLAGAWFLLGSRPAVVARIDSVSGTVVVLPDQSAAVAGREILAGQGLETSGKDGRLTLAFPDGTRIHVEGYSTLPLIDDGKDGKRVSILRGVARATVARQPAGKPMLFLTTQAQAEVLGTTLELQVDRDSRIGTRLDVKEGKVRLKNWVGKSVDVRGGQYAVAASGTELRALRLQAAPPYAIPAPGNAAAISVNRPVDVAASVSTPPASMSTALFGAYGGGTFVRDYSSRGAYVLTALGGHASPTAIAGAVLFDFEDATWKGFENSNGIASNGNGWTANSNGAPWQEWTGTEVPLPCHPYLIAAELPASRGGGPKGSVVFVGRAAVTSDGGGGRGPHALNLETRRWSRLTSADHPRVAGIYTSVVFDEQSGRYYSIASIENRKDVPYYDAADWSVLHATTPQYGWPAFGGGSQAFLDPVRRLIIDFAGNRELHAFQVDNPGAGWSVLPVTGTMPAITSAEPNRFVFYPPDGNFYYRPVNSGGAVLHRLKPPAGNPLTQAWTADTVQLAQSMPDCDSVSSNGAWYSFFFYVPSIQCLAWVVGADKPVYILKPPGDAPAPAAAPTITAQPLAQTVLEGDSGTFTVTAVGTAPLSYQWQRNGTAIPGATEASYVTSAAVAADSGATFRVVVTNSSGSVTSNSAGLTVTPSSAPPPAPAPTPPPSPSPGEGKEGGKCGCASAGLHPWLGPGMAAALLVAILLRRGR